MRPFLALGRVSIASTLESAPLSPLDFLRCTRASAWSAGRESHLGDLWCLSRLPVLRVGRLRSGDWSAWTGFSQGPGDEVSSAVLRSVLREGNWHLEAGTCVDGVPLPSLAVAPDTPLRVGHNNSSLCSFRDLLEGHRDQRTFLTRAGVQG